MEKTRIVVDANLFGDDQKFNYQVFDFLSVLDKDMNISFACDEYMDIVSFRGRMMHIAEETGLTRTLRQSCSVWEKLQPGVIGFVLSNQNELSCNYLLKQNKDEPLLRMGARGGQLLKTSAPFLLRSALREREESRIDLTDHDNAMTEAFSDPAVKEVLNAGGLMALNNIFDAVADGDKVLSDELCSNFFKKYPSAATAIQVVCDKAQKVSGPS